MPNPLELLSHIEAAADAEKKSDFATAVQHYRALAEMVPEQALPQSKLCELYEKLSQPGQALTACRTALGLEGTKVKDHLGFIRLLVARSGPLTSEDVEDADAVLQHIQTELGQGAQLEVVKCELGVKLGDPARLKACTDELARLMPNDARTITYRWSLAILEGDRTQAERILEAAAASGTLPPEALEHLRELTLSSPISRNVWLASGAALLILAAGGWILWHRRRPARPVEAA